MKYEYSIEESLLFCPFKRLNKTKLKKILNNKTVLITGASFGIGEAIAKKMADFNVHLILLARTTEKLLKIKNYIEAKQNADVEIFSVDFYDLPQVDDLLKKFEKKNLIIDYFISNAGKSIKRSIWAALDRFHDFERTMKVNYLAPVKLALYFLSKMPENGHIISISAINVLFKPVAGWSAYQTSKVAFDQWAKSIAQELRRKKIYVSTLYLPLVRTRMIAPTKEYEKMPAMNSEHVADILLKLLYSVCKKTHNSLNTNTLQYFYQLEYF